MLYTTVIIIYTYRFSKSINILGKFCMPYQHHINIRRGSQEITVDFVESDIWLISFWNGVGPSLYLVICVLTSANHLFL